MSVTGTCNVFAFASICAISVSRLVGSFYFYESASLAEFYSTSSSLSDLVTPPIARAHSRTVA